MYSCLSNQLALMMMLDAQGEVTTRELALSLGITERAVHRILKDLADQGFISIGKRGYRNHYTVHLEQSVGHPAFPWLTVGDLLGPIHDRLAKADRAGGATPREMALAV